MNTSVQICQKACDEYVYNVYKIKQYAGTGLYLRRLSTLLIEPYNSYIEIAEEYTIIDGIALICAIGGALGLFLGFSFLGCGMDVIGLIIRFRKYLSYYLLKKRLQNMEQC